MKDLSIDINVAGKEYTLHVKEEEKEAVIEAAKKINDTFSLLSSKYAVKDSRDLMAMTALNLVSDLLKDKGENDLEEDAVFYQEVNSRLESMLS
ncbi:MAG: cell division protein ZapA [Bacteroidota bacterium]